MVSLRDVVSGPHVVFRRLRHEHANDQSEDHQEGRESHSEISAGFGHLTLRYVLRNIVYVLVLSGPDEHLLRPIIGDDFIPRFVVQRGVARFVQRASLFLLRQSRASGERMRKKRWVYSTTMNQALAGHRSLRCYDEAAEQKDACQGHGRWRGEREDCSWWWEYEGLGARRWRYRETESKASHLL